jgi:Holliday junction DNA helicase RuvA
MIASISGSVKHVSLTSVVIEVGAAGGIGMLVHVPASLAASLIVGKSAELATTLVVREDALTLYGFETASARDFFELLQTVSGIGPKVAQSALSMMDEVELSYAIATGESVVLERIPGLGKKGVQRLILELKDKVLVSSQSRTTSTQLWRASINEALINLGYSQRESDKAIDAVAAELGSHISAQPVADVLKLVLQQLGRA